MCDQVHWSPPPSSMMPLQLLSKPSPVVSWIPGLLSADPSVSATSTLPAGQAGATLPRKAITRNFFVSLPRHHRAGDGPTVGSSSQSPAAMLYPSPSASGLGGVATPTHRPAPSHWSPVVPALPSSHTVPVGAEGEEHRPFAGSPSPTRWHASAARHDTTTPFTHSPATHDSWPLQALPSAQSPSVTQAGAVVVGHTRDVDPPTQLMTAQSPSCVVVHPASDTSGHRGGEGSSSPHTMTMHPIGSTVTLHESPGAPSAPSAPSSPSAPGAPSVPSVPSLPSTPSLPGVPSTPSAPSIPGAPSAPSPPPAREPPGRVREKFPTPSLATVHLSPSSHPSPATGTEKHPPVPPAMVPQNSAVHASPSSQVTDVLLHTPSVHASSVQASPSSHARGVPTQVPTPSHTSVSVQPLPSSQVTPASPFMWTHESTPGGGDTRHQSVVHGSSSLHSRQTTRSSLSAVSSSAVLSSSAGTSSPGASALVPHEAVQSPRQRTTAMLVVRIVFSPCYAICCAGTYEDHPRSTELQTDAERKIK